LCKKIRDEVSQSNFIKRGMKCLRDEVSAKMAYDEVSEG
jgi:hypothetical protein